MTQHNIALAIDALKDLLGDRLSTGKSIREIHGRDEAYSEPALPDAVAFPESTQEVSAIVKICARYKVPVVPFGIGTSLEGHVIPTHGGISVDTSRMNKILEIHESDLDAVVQPGVSRTQLNEELRATGLFFPVDPGANASLGGMASTRASGTTTVRYGTMRENVLGLTVVTAQGEGGHFQNRLYMNTGPVDDLDPEVRRTSVVAPAKGEFGPFPVRTAVFDQYTSDRGFYPRSIELVYTVDGGRETVIEMDWSGNSVWRGEIPAVDPCSLVTYFVRAEDRAGNVGVGVTVDFETTGTCGSIADLNGDGLVNGADVGLLLAQWGGPGTADFNGSGTVDGGDLGIMLVEWTG